jgi:hypothetical protein
MSSTTPQVNSGDPAVAIQVQRENAALQRQSAIARAPSVSGSSTTTTTTASRTTRSIAPVVSGAEVLYPQSTTTTSSNAVTINSSVNNDVGDVTTVYSTNGAITVNPINQTINQYTSVDSGVSQIVAGNGVTITSTGGGGTGIVTINSVTTTLGNIVTVNLDGNSANVLHGDGTWSADQTTYGNSNVAAYLPTYTGNVGAGNVNVTGTVYANGLSSTGLASLTTLNVSTTANLGAVGNITITGGTNGQFLTTNGNGVLSWSAGGGGLPLANGNSNFNIATANGNATVTTAGAQTWTFGTDGNLTIPNDIISNNTIEIDNRASGNTADIIIYSADDITLQARDRPIGATAEGGDINIFAGDSAEDSDTSAGDVIIEAGAGGASNIDFGGSGGFVRVEAGRGGAASTDANGFSALSGGSLTLNAGDAGTNNGNIFRGASGGDVTINAGDSTGNGDPGGSIILRAGDAGANALAGQIQLIISSSDVGPGGTWTFDGEGIIQLPNSGTIGNDGNNIDIGSSNAISLEASSAVNIYTDTGTAAWQWQFQDDGNLRLPTIELDVGNTINEQTVIQSQRKVIPGLRYSVEIDGSTPTTVYTATSIDTTAMKVTMQIQHQSLGIEFFDVSATSSGSDTYYTVSNRLHPPGITDSTVVVDFNGSNIMEITVTINSGATTSWVTYDAVEFGIPQD